MTLGACGFKFPVPSTKWGFLVVWQAPPGAQATPGLLVCRKKHAQERYAVNFEILFVFTEEC